MLGIFKKSSWKIEGKILCFFKELFSKLPTESQFLSEQLDQGLYRRYAVNHALKGNHYSISFDPSQSDKSMTKGKQFELEKIIVKSEGQKYDLNLSIYDGLLIGFEFEKNIKDLKEFEIDLSNLKRQKSKFTADPKIEKLVKGLVSEKLELIDLSELEIDGNLYYQIKDLEDGNCIAIDRKGRVFGLIHNPYKIELIYESINQFVEEVNNGKFKFDDYLNK